MDPSEEVCRSLIKWLQTVSSGSRSSTDISDGAAMLHTLVTISPEHFSRLEPKIKLDVGSNWRLKVSNLKKIIETVTEYYQDILNLQLLDAGKPDVLKLGETSDIIELGKLIRLILGCAVNCDKKQEYITQIMAMEEAVQQSIMQAIQQLEEVTGGPGRSGLSLLSLDSDSRIVRLIGELETANEAKETLAQTCHNLEVQVQCLLEEKQALLLENQSLGNQFRERETLGSERSPDTRRQMERLKEELFKVETVRDDYRAKITEQEKQIITFQEKVLELQLAADATSRLKDEIDALSESADKVKALEITVAAYKKKLEDYADTKKQLKILEEKNVEYFQQIIKFEEELAKSTVYKSQSELYKKQATDLQLKFDDEIQRADKVTFQLKNAENKLAAVQREKESLAQDRNALLEENEELKLGQQKGDGGAVMALELAPDKIKERLRFLENENHLLKINGQELAAKQLLFDDALSRLEKLAEQNRTYNQRVLELESQLEEQKDQLEEQVMRQMEATLKEYKQKLITLQDTLASKEHELQTSQAKYNRSLEKAREVAANIELKNGSGITKENKETEERSTASAFYRLGSQCQREAVDERLALLSAGQGQSFLSRQRHPLPRKPVEPFKSK